MIKILFFAFLLSFSVARDVNQAGLNIIKQFNKFVPNFYKDSSVGLNSNSKLIGYGHNCDAHRDCSNIRPPISREFGEKLLKGDLNNYQNCVAKEVFWLNDNQFSALVSFVYNVGCEQFRSSRLLTYLEQRNMQVVADELLKWVHSKGIKLDGLVKRRQVEKELFLKQ